MPLNLVYFKNQLNYWKTESEKSFTLELFCKLLWFSYNFFYIFILFLWGRVMFSFLFPWQTFIQQKKHHLIACVRETAKHHMPNAVSSTE